MERQLPRVSPETPVSVLSQLCGGPKHGGEGGGKGVLGQLPQPGAWWLLKEQACGTRGGSEQEEVSAGLPCMSGARQEESKQAWLQNLRYRLL